MKLRPKSELIFKKLQEVIPGGVNSPVRSCKSMSQIPMVVESAKGDLVYDADDHCYIDYCGSWGALIHGHCHPEILDAAQQRIAKGTTFGITSSIEEQLARKVTTLIESIEKIRFVSTGTEATMSAVRLARGFTNRQLIIKFDGNFHGHADFFLVNAGSGVLGLNSSSSSTGIPEDIIKHTISLPYNDIETCKKFILSPDYRNNIAAVILEPIAANMGVVPASKKFLQMLRETTKQIGALLIFDEVITGFRVGLQGAQGLYDIHPDLTCFGKIIGGGFPAAAFGGRSEIMDMLAPLGQVYQAGTLSGNPVAMEAGLKAINLLENPEFYVQLNSKTDYLLTPIKAYIDEHPEKQLCLQRQGSMFTLFFGRRNVTNSSEAQLCNNELFAQFFRFMFQNGVYIPPLQWEAWFISSVHEEKHLLKTQLLVLEFISSDTCS